MFDVFEYNSQKSSHRDDFRKYLLFFSKSKLFIKIFLNFFDYGNKPKKDPKVGNIEKLRKSEQNKGV